MKINPSLIITLNGQTAIQTWTMVNTVLYGAKLMETKENILLSNEIFIEFIARIKR